MANIRQLSLDFNTPPDPVSLVNEEETGRPARVIWGRLEKSKYSKSKINN